MNTKITMILMIITIGMFFGCIESASETTIQKPTPVQIELAEIEYYENSTSESASETTTQKPIPVQIIEQTPLPTSTPEQELDRQAIIDRINYLQECPETQELYEKQEEYNILIRAIEYTIKENAKLADPIEVIEGRIEDLRELIEWHEQQIENIPIFEEEIEELKIEVQICIEELLAEEEKLRDDSLSDEERTEINNNIKILKDKLYWIEDDLFQKETRLYDATVSSPENIEHYEKSIEECYDDIRKIEDALFTPEEMEKLEAEIDDLFAERNIYVDIVHGITKEIEELKALLAEMQ